MPDMSRRSFVQAATAASAGMLAAPALAEAGRNLSATGDSFEVGVATRDITPELGVPLWGYSNAERLAEGAISPLHLRAVVFRTGGRAVGLVSLELGRMPLSDQCARIRAVAKSAGIDEVILCATHTHSGPYMEMDLPHVPKIEAAIVDGLKEALGKAQPARIGVGRAAIDISHNRRFIKDGQCYMMWRNAERKPTAPVDHEAGVIRIDTADGKPLVTLVHYACHPVVFGPDNKKYSADWAGEMCTGVEAATGGACLFLQGGAGDINPYLDKTPIAEGGIEAMQQEGRKAADAVLAAHQGITTAAPAAPSVAYREDLVEVGLRHDVSKPDQAAILRAVSERLYDFYITPFIQRPAVPVGVLVLNNTLALVCQSGEFFVQFQLDLKQKSPLPDTFLCGYANEFHIYFPTIKDAAVGGYGASTATYVGVGAGEKCVNHSLIMLCEMIGKFGPLKGPEDFALQELPS